MNIEEVMEKMRRDLGATASPGSVLPPDELMRRVRAEVARKRQRLGDPADQGAREQGSAPAPAHWAPSAERLPFRTEYRLQDLLSFSDLDFVDQCYRLVLRRPPDRAGLEHYVAQLRLGLMSKVEILGILRFSPEGVSRGVHVDGLLVPYRLHQMMKWRLVGPVLRWFHGMLRLGSYSARLQQLDAVQSRESHCLGHTLNRVAAQLDERITEAGNAIAAARDQAACQANEVQARLEARAAEMEAVLPRFVRQEDLARDLGAAEERTRSIEAALAQLARQDAFDALADEARKTAAALAERATHEEVEALKGALQASLDELRGLSGQLEARIAVGEEALAGIDAVRARAEETARALDPFYAAFEDRFRGSRELVRHRVEPYLQWMRDAGAGTREAPVLDLGCGRGEWLELLRDHQMYASGIDLNATFIETCRGRGLEVQHADVLAGLAGRADQSVGAVTSMHLVEHLPFEAAIALIDEARRVLRPGGLLLLETPNPENLRVGAHWFYLDPTHRNPIPPETLRWLVESRGFQAVRIERLTHGREMPWPARLADDVPGAEAINAISDQFAAAPDYAIVAVRP